MLPLDGTRPSSRALRLSIPDLGQHPVLAFLRESYAERWFAAAFGVHQEAAVAPVGHSPALALRLLHQRLADFIQRQLLSDQGCRFFVAADTQVVDKLHQAAIWRGFLGSPGQDIFGALAHPAFGEPPVVTGLRLAEIARQKILPQPRRGVDLEVIRAPRTQCNPGMAVVPVARPRHPQHFPAPVAQAQYLRFLGLLPTGEAQVDHHQQFLTVGALALPGCTDAAVASQTAALLFQPDRSFDRQLLRRLRVQLCRPNTVFLPEDALRHRLRCGRTKVADQRRLRTAGLDAPSRHAVLRKVKPLLGDPLQFLVRQTAQSCANRFQRPARICCISTQLHSRLSSRGDGRRVLRDRWQCRTTAEKQHGREKRHQHPTHPNPS
ncbi:MAG TPA: hypothetical protein VD969_15665 [Symbiobacteriaceae bacterium]|nr:hypothetical protein [Symbiobacteriaceae bacterium]